MPADNPGGLSETNYANIVAYILQYNGVAAGTTPLTPTTDVRIGGPAPCGCCSAHEAQLRQPLPRRRQQDAAQARRVRPQEVDADADRNRRPLVSR